MVRDKFNFSGILTFLVLGVAVCVLGAHVFGALSVDGADCDTEGIWSKGVRPMASVTVGTLQELQAALDSGVEEIILGANMAWGGSLSLTISRAVTIEGNGKTISFSGSGPVMTVDYSDIPASGLVTVRNLTITGGGSAGIEAVKNDSAYKYLDVLNCTIRGNSGPGILHSGNGIGLGLFVMNSTITANGACGIFVSGGNPRVDVSHGTIVNNGGGGITHMSGTPIVRGSIILGNANGQVPGDRDVSNSVIEGHPLPNPRGNVPGTYAQVFGTNQLANNDTKNGTQTIALITGSPAINLGATPEEHFDQRGFPRPGTGKTNGVCDAGAYETQPQSPGPGVTVTLNHTNLALKVDESATLTATVSPADAPNKNVSWQGSGSGTLDIENIDDWNRRITGRSPGNHTITVTALDGGATTTCNVTVTSGDVPPPPVPVLSKTSLNLAPDDTDYITSTVDGSWDVSNSDVVEISDVDMATLSVSGKTVYVKANALGSAVITFTHSDGKMSVPVFVSPKAIVDMNKDLASDDVWFNILSPDLFPDVSADVDKNAPVILCYEPSGKPAGIIEVDISDPVLYPNPENVFLPMQYTLGLTEAEMNANCAKVGRAINMANLFASDGTPSLASLNEFFNVFVIQKEIMQGPRKGSLARLMGMGSDQIITPQDAITAGILTVNVNTAERKIYVEFRYMVKDGDAAPKLDGKQIIVGDGLADERIIDPLWTNARKKTGGGTDGPVDGGGGCNAAPGFAGVLMLGIFAAPLIFRKRK